MAPADETKKEDKETPSTTVKAEEAKKVPLTLKQELKANLALLARAVELFEPRLSARVLRTLTTVRRKLSRQADGLLVLRQVMEESYPKGDSTLASLLATIPTTSPSAVAADSMDVDASATATDEEPATAAKPPPAKEVTEIVPEQDIYLRLLAGLVLLDAKELAKATDLFSSTVELIQKLNRRSLDHLAAKVYFYLGRVFEIQGRDADLRPLLLAAHRTATLRHDEDLQSTLINLLLRNYFNHNLLDQADKLVAKSHFPDSAANGQLARYLYYTGRIRAVQLDYSQAHEDLQQAIRRAPAAHIAPGFLQTAYKFFVVVDLLMGNIPERSTFRLPVLKTALVPYFQIVQAVRVGDLSAFQTALSTHGATFRSDGTQTLILRLRHNVIKTGLAQIARAYSKISLGDICAKLQLDGEEDAEYIVAKAIRDGVVPPGVGVDHAKGWLVGSAQADVLETAEPRKVFGKRIDFCLELHNESVKAMRYPLNAHRKDLNSGAEARERERELVTDIAEGNVDEDDEMDF